MRRNGPAAVVAVVVLFAVAVKAVKWVADYVSAHLIQVIAGAGVVVLLVLAGAVLRAVAAARAQAYEHYLSLHIDDTDTMSGTEFEHWCATLLSESGLRRVTVSGGSGDLGADVTGDTGDGRRVVVQCKRWAGSVGSPEIQKFAGTVRDIHGADVALFLTTGRPTVAARDLAARLGITIVDRPGLARWAAGGPPPVTGLTAPAAGGSGPHPYGEPGAAAA